MDDLGSYFQFFEGPQIGKKTRHVSLDFNQWVKNYKDFNSDFLEKCFLF